VDGTGSGSCPLAGFGVSGAEPPSYVTKEFILMRRGVTFVKSIRAVKSFQRVFRKLRPRVL
jgi:hypothetical protein